jgi:hypothetical protein
MKRKELHDYIRTEIINELSLAEKLYREKPGSDPQSKNPDLVSTQPNSSLANDSQFRSKYEPVSEMARIANKITLGDSKQVKLALDVYEGSILEKLINLVKEAGEGGLTQDELAEKLGIDNSSVLNSHIKTLVKLKAFSKPEKETKPTEKPTPEPTPSAVPSGDEDDWEAAAEKDDWEKVDDEDEEADKGPSASDIKAAEKSAAKATGGKGYAKQLPPEEEEKYNRLRAGIEAKISKILALPKTKRSSSTDLQVLKTLIKRDDVKKLFKAKGVNLNDLVSDVMN